MVEDETDLLMRCMLLAFQYYPPSALPQQPLAHNLSSTAQFVNDTANLVETGIPATIITAITNAATGATATTIITTTTTVHPSLEVSDNARDFMADCTRSSPERPYDLSLELKLMWACLFGAMLLVAIVGNCIVIWIVLGESHDAFYLILPTKNVTCILLIPMIRILIALSSFCQHTHTSTAHREMRTITNYFLLNLSVADLLMSSLNGIFNFVSMLNSDWPFGSLYCSVNNFMAYVTVATSVFTLVAISFDRYVAIVRPLHRRNSRKKARIFLTIIWALAGTLSLPGLVYSATESKRYHNGRTRTVCFVLWPDGRYPVSATDYVYNIVFLLLTYVVPMLVMCVCYTLMGRELWGSKSIGEHTERQRESVCAKKKVVRMFIAVVAIFGICWLPYHMFYVYAYHNPQITASAFVPHLYLGFYWLAMANSMVNPIIYYWMNRKFRHYFQEAMCCVRLCSGVDVVKTTPDGYVQQQQQMQMHSMSADRRKSCKL